MGKKSSKTLTRNQAKISDKKGTQKLHGQKIGQEIGQKIGQKNRAKNVSRNQTKK